MGMVGCLGDIVFTVSDRTIETINNVTWSGSARYATHQRHGTHALTEFTGLDPDKMTFDIVLSAYLGVDPIADLQTVCPACHQFMHDHARLQRAIHQIGTEKALAQLALVI